jgi:hypothetical protein
MAGDQTTLALWLLVLAAAVVVAGGWLLGQGRRK